jgi:hypothetical protein
MAGQQRKELVITGLRGRDGSTPAEIAIPNHKAKEMENVDLYRTAFARKRNGCENAFDDTSSEVFTDVMAFLGRHIPGAAETAAMLWGMDADFVLQYLSGGTAWATPTVKDAFDASPYDVNGISFNGKYWLLGDTAQDRAHLWDGSTVRRAGLATPAAPTLASIAGSYVVLRYYRVRYAELSGTTIIRKGEPSVSANHTPAGGASRITKPASLSEGETHWEIEVSTDNTVWYYVTRVVVGTTTYDDTADPSSHTTLAPIAGEYVAPVSAKYGLVDGNRMLLAGSWETSTYTSRVWHTPRLGTLNGDDERIPASVEHSNWTDIDEKDGDFITGLHGPFEGMPIVSKYRHVWGMRPTGSDTSPYKPIVISKVVGCIRQQLALVAEDENGNPCWYFWSHRGPYRFGVRGLQYCGDDLKDYLDPDGPYGGINLDATAVTGFAVHHTDKHQIWFYVSVGTRNSPEHIFKFDTRLGEPDEDNQVRDGWTIDVGTVATGRCAVMFSTTLAASMSRDLKPYLGTGVEGSSAKLLRCDTGELDDGEPYAGTVTIPEKHLGGLRHKCEVDQMLVLGSSGPHTLGLTMHRDYGCEARQSEVAMAAETGDQTRSQRVVEAAFHADAMSIGARIGDVCPIGHPWNLDALVIQYEQRQEIAG